MGKTNQNENINAAQGQEKDTTRPMKSKKQRVHDMEEAANKAGRGIKKGAGFVGKGIREGMIDVASLGISVIVGDAVSTAANNTFIKGVAAANNGFNTLTGKGTVNVKTRFGGWKSMTLSDYTAAVNRGVKFKDAQADFFVNRHASEFNTAGKIIGGVAGGTAGVGSFVASRNTLKSVTMTKGEKLRAVDELNRQTWGQMMDDTSSDYSDDDEEQ